MYHTYPTSRVNLILLLFTYLLRAFLDDIGGEVWELLEEGVLAPHGLGRHLGQLHGTQSRREPPVAAQHVHTCLDQSNSLHSHVERMKA